MTCPRSRRGPIRTGCALAAGVVLAVAAGACGSSSSHATSGGTIASTVVAGPSTSAPPLPPKTPISIPVATDSVSPDGSGCDPGTGDSLPNGIWYGILKSVDPATSSIGLDLACWYSGKSAQAITGSSGPVDDDIYVRNQNPKIYTVGVVTDVAVVPLATSPTGDPTGQLAPATSGLASAQAILSASSDHGVWLMITDGVATVIQAQFRP